MINASQPPPTTDHLNLLICEGWQDYALLDMGEGRRLERFGTFLVDRPEEQAMGARTLDAAIWAKADAIFQAQAGGIDGRWTMARGASAPERFDMNWNKLPFYGRFTAFRHMGFFPEQASHWNFLEHALASSKEQPKILNLFGYTGLASLIAARAGAHVTHVDASKRAIAYARENQTRAGLDDKPIRWIVDDAVAFVARERRRGNRYHGIILDPPKFGRGPKGEEWELFDHLPAHLEECISLLADDARFLILTAYAIRASALALDDLMRQIFSRTPWAKRPHHIETGELAIRADTSGRLLSTSLYSRWSAR